MTPSSDAIDRAAMDWLIRVQDPTFDSWDDWEGWLTRDPRHADAYWRLAEDDAELVDPATARRPVPSQATHWRNTMPVRRPVRRVGLPAAIAAGLVLACGVFWFMLGRSTEGFETGPGAPRSVVLADGTTAHLAGGTRLTRASGDRRVRLDAGRALFEVRHDADRPFTVLVDDAEIVDLGTVFDVTRLETGVRVAVAEGVVRVDGEAGSERLEAGETLLAIDGRMTRSEVDVAEVSAWRGGRLSYRGAPLALVGEDLGRALGWSVRIAPSLAARPFTGSLDTTGERSAVRTRVQTVLGVQVIEDNGDWRLAPAPSAP